MENQIAQIAERIRGLRIIMDIPVSEMAQFTGVSEEEYIACEDARQDFSFTFLYKCANRFGIDISELITGDMPKLSFYSIVRKGEGLPIERRKGFKYQHLAYLFKSKISEPFYVTARYREEEQNEPIHLSTHKGQEFDYVIKGSMKVQLENHIEILNEGDSIYYNSIHGHGMIAINGEDCEFLAVVMKREGTRKRKRPGSKAYIGETGGYLQWIFYIKNSFAKVLMKTAC